MPPAQAGTASAVASTARQVGSVLGVALLGSVVTSQLHRQLQSRLANLRLPAAEKARLLHPSVGASAAGGGGPAVRRAVGAAFTAAGHAGWDITVGAGLAVTLAALVTTGGWATRRAEEAVGDLS